MDTLLIKVMDIVAYTSTNDNAKPLFEVLKQALTDKRRVHLSFENCSSLSSSFLNSSLGDLIDIFGVESVRTHIRFVNCSQSTADRIKYYMAYFLDPVK